MLSRAKKRQKPNLQLIQHDKILVRITAYLVSYVCYFSVKIGVKCNAHDGVHAFSSSLIPSIK